MTDTLEENIKKIEETKEELEKAMIGINKYREMADIFKREIENREYKINSDKRDDLVIVLNYLQNQVIIENQNQIIEYLRELYLKMGFKR